MHVTVTNLLTATVDTTVCANKVPFTWNGISVTGSGDYPYSSVSSGGCDSTTTLHVTVTNLLTATVDTTVCANKVPFTWNGISVTGSGDYPFTSVSSGGCDSTTTLHVTVTNLLTATVDTTVCANKVPFTWNGITVTGSGDYPYTTTFSSGGCDSTTTLHVTVTNLLTATVDTTVCANKVPFTWNGMSVTGSGDYPYHFSFFRRM